MSASLWGLFASGFVSSTLLPGNSEAVLSWLALNQTASVSVLLLVATAGNTLGGMTNLFIGNWAARRYPLKFAGNTKHQFAMNRVKRWGSPILLFSWVPIVGDPLCVAAGWLGLPLLASTTFMAAGKALRYAALLWILV